MGSPTSVTVLVILIAGISFLLVFFLSGLLTRQAVDKIIRKLRDLGATQPASAVSAEELGLKKSVSGFARALKGQSPGALQLLLQNNVVVEAENGKYYLSEENLAASEKQGRDGSSF